MADNDSGEDYAKAAFLEEAKASRVVDPELAWLAAQSKGLVGENGKVDMQELRFAHPALFEKVKVPRGNAGNGRGQGDSPQRPLNMNDMIRGGIRAGGNVSWTKKYQR